MRSGFIPLQANRFSLFSHIQTTTRVNQQHLHRFITNVLLEPVCFSWQTLRILGLYSNEPFGKTDFFSPTYNYYKHKWALAVWNPENWAVSDCRADGQWIKSFISTIEQLHTLDNRSQFSSAHKEVYQFLSACPAGVKRQITR